MKRTLVIVLLIALAALAALLAGPCPGAAPPPSPVPGTGGEEAAAADERPAVGTAAEDPGREEPAGTPGREPPPPSADVEPASPFLAGRVVLPNGEPVEGALVTLLGEYDDLRREGVPPANSWERLHRTRSGPGGTFSWPGKPEDLGYRLPAGGFLVRAEGAGGVSLPKPVVLREEGCDAGDLVLLPALEIRGEVVDSAGAPVEGARAALNLGVPIEEFPPGRHTNWLTIGDVSDAEGRLDFPPIPRRDDWDLSIEVAAEGRRTVDRDVDLSEVLAGQPIRIVMASGLLVRGVVLLADGTPAVKYEIRAGVRRYGRFPHLPLHEQTLTDERGAFTVSGVPVEHGLLSVRRSVLEFALHVDVPAGRAGDVIDLGTIRMPALGVIRGRVLLPDGTPAAGATVFADSTGEYTGNRSGRTDADGRFRIEKVPPGDYEVEVDVQVAEDDRIHGVLRGARPGDDEVVIRPTVNGSVLFVFHLAAKPDEPFDAVSPDIDAERGSWSGGGAMKRKRIYPPPGEQAFTVTVQGYRPVEFPAVEVAPDAETVLHVRLEPE